MLLSISISNHCNLDCVYCSVQEKGTSPVLDLEDIFKFIDTYSKPGEANVIEFFGGEPTLHYESHILPIFNRYSNKYDWRIYTNGLNLDKVDKTMFADFKEIIISLDGEHEFNNARKLNIQQYTNIIQNISALLKINPNTGVAFVLSNKAQYRNIIKTIDYFYDLGVRYFSPEPCTVFTDKTYTGFDQEDFYYYMLGCMHILHKSFDKTISYLNLPREVLDRNFFFRVEGPAKCNDTVRALSPRNKVYLCRDHAANEESLYVNTKVVKLEDLNKHVEGLQIKNDNFDHLNHLNDLTACPVKSLQYKEFGIKELWWTKPPFSKFMESIYLLNNINSDYIFSHVLKDGRQEDFDPASIEQAKSLFNSLKGFIFEQIKADTNIPIDEINERYFSKNQDAEHGTRRRLSD